MRSLGTLRWAAILLAVVSASKVMAQQGPSDVPTIRVTSSLVFLDVTVLDKKGHPVVTGLTKDDFAVTEDKNPQRIFSFEAPETHTMGANADDDSPDGKAPVTIFVLDLLNSSFEDFVFIRYAVHRDLEAQPAQLTSPAEMMVIGNRSLELLQGYTRNKEDLLFTLDHLPAALPYKWMGGDVFTGERFEQSVDALQQIALQNKGVPGRKNIIWVGYGSPSFSTNRFTGQAVNELRQYMHATTNMLVDSRISLFLIYPGLKIGHFVNLSGKSPVPISVADAHAEIGSGEPFGGDINFGTFVNETGGDLFYDRNDVDAEINRSEKLGSEYYTLTYQPHEGDANGKFRRIRVTLRDPNLRAVTKTGYFAPDGKVPVAPQQQTAINLSEAARSTVPFTALDMKISGVVRHPDTRTAEVTVLLKGKSLGWQPAKDGEGTAVITLAAASLTGSQKILASKVQRLFLTTPTQDATHWPALETRLQFTIQAPHKTQDIRVVVEAENGGRIGAVDLDRQTIDTAPATPTPEPQLVPHQVSSQQPAGQLAR